LSPRAINRRIIARCRTRNQHGTRCQHHSQPPSQATRVAHDELTFKSSKCLVTIFTRR
jgi:hypothetical protein